MADINVGAISEALNNKADLDLHNLNNEGKKSVTLAGMVTAFAGTTAPTGWLKCDGSAISRTTYSALFAAIGTKYGAGDGSTTFNLPTQSVLPLGTSAPITGQAYGNGKTLGLTDGTNLMGLQSANTSNYGAINAVTALYNTNVGTDSRVSTPSAGVHKGLGITTNSSQSGIIVSGTADLTKATGATAIVCIKY